MRAGYEPACLDKSATYLESWLYSENITQNYHMYLMLSEINTIQHHEWSMLRYRTHKTIEPLALHDFYTPDTTTNKLLLFILLAMNKYYLASTISHCTPALILLNFSPNFLVYLIACDARVVNTTTASSDEWSLTWQFGCKINTSTRAKRRLIRE